MANYFNPMPTFDFMQYAYFATVNTGVCPGYTEPYGKGGHKDGQRWYRGDRVEIIAAESSACGGYVSAFTVSGSWINIWRLHNRRGQAVGVNFCRIEQRLRRIEDRTHNASRIMSLLLWEASGA